MKKLLSLLSILTISGTAMPNVIVANSYKKVGDNINYEQNNNLEINNQKLSTNDYLEFNNKIIEKVDMLPKFEETNKSILNNYFIKDNDFYFLNKSNNISEKINGIENKVNSWNKVIFNDKKNNIYFGTSDGLYKLKYSETTANKLNVTNGIKIDFGIIDSNDNIYIGTDGNNDSLSEALFVIKNNVLIKINGIEQTLGSYSLESNGSNKIILDSKNNVYVVGYSNNIYFIKSGETNATKIDNIDVNGSVSSVVIDNEDNAYFRTNNAIYILKHNTNTTIKIIQTEESFNYLLLIDNVNNIYFKMNDNFFVIKTKKIKLFEIIKSQKYIDTNIINNNIFFKNKNLYFITNYAFILKHDETIPIKINSNNQEVSSLAVDNNDNIYMLFSDNQRLSPFILRKNTNTLIKINGVNGHISHIFADNNNNIYIASGNGLYTLKSGETNATKIEITSSQISSLVFDKNNNVYFATDYDGAFLLKSGETNATKIEGINKKYGYYVEVFKDKKYDIIYFKTGGALYKLNGGENKVFKIIQKQSPIFFISDYYNNTYFMDNYDNNIYVLKKDETLLNKINGIDNTVSSIETDTKGNVYFITNNGLYTLKSGETNATKINHIFSDIIGTFSCNDDIYLITNNKIYIIKDKKIIDSLKIDGTFEKNNYSIFKDNYYLYFISSNSLILIKINLSLNKEIKNNNLEEIKDNNDETIINNLNYLNCENNYFLNLNKMKVINKTLTSATIEAVKGKYRGQVTVNYKIKNKDEFSTIDLSNLLKKSFYFDFIDKNFYSINKIKKIKNINTDNLNFLNIEVTRDSKLLHSIDFKDVCFNKKIFNNISSKDTQKRKVPKCDYNTKLKLKFQIIKGLTKINQENKLYGWNINTDDEIKLSDFININNKNSKIMNILSDSFDLSNTNKQEQEMILQSFNEDDYEISIDPKTKLEIKYSVREINLETVLNLKQKIMGNITAKIIDDNDKEQIITLSIKEAMEILKKYSLLPDEITINEDKNITFNGKAKISLTQESEQKLINKISNI